MLQFMFSVRLIMQYDTMRSYNQDLVPELSRSFRLQECKMVMVNTTG